jgi:molybdate transport system substrate-binding protein
MNHRPVTWRRMTVPFLAGLLLLVPLLASGCRGTGEKGLVVFAATSLSDALQDVGKTFAQEHGVRVRFNFGASTALAQQLLRGAPADIFIAAGAQPVDMLASRGLLLEGSRIDLLTNTLVLVGRAEGSPQASSIPQLLLGASRIAIADPQAAPAGRYAQQALENLGVWERLQGRLVFAADVRTALAYVASGNVQLGIVYATDARGNSRVRVLEVFPAESHATIVYPAVILKGTEQRVAAEAFVAFLQSSVALELFRMHGFVPVE